MKPARKAAKSRPGVKAWCPVCGRTRTFRTVRKGIIYQLIHELENNRHLVILYAHGPCTDTIWDEDYEPLWSELSQDDQDEDNESDVRA